MHYVANENHPGSLDSCCVGCTFDEFLNSELPPLLGDMGISPRVRAQLARLATLLKHSHPQEPSTWAGRDRPLPVFLRRLTALGRRDQDSGLRDFTGIEAVVRRVVADGVCEADSFERGAEALHALARREVERLLQQRAAEPAVDPVQAVVKKLSSGMQLPGPARIIAEEMLRPWLARCHQDFGPHSLHWFEGCETARLFFEALRPAVGTEEQRSRRALRQQAMWRIEDFARRAPGAEITAAAFLFWLEDYLVRVDDGAAPAAAQVLAA